MRCRHAYRVEDRREGLRASREFGETVLHEAIADYQAQRDGSPAGRRIPRSTCQHFDHGCLEIHSCGNLRKIARIKLERVTTASEAFRWRRRLRYGLEDHLGVTFAAGVSKPIPVGIHKSMTTSRTGCEKQTRR